MAAEINRLRAELESERKAKQDEAEAARKKQLEEQGKWQEIATDAQSKYEAALKAHEAEVKRLTLEAGLAGIDNEFTREGIIAKCPGDVDPKNYIADLKENHPELFTSNDSLPRTTPQGIRSSSGTSNWAADKALIDKANEYPGTVDPVKLQAAWDRKLKYFNEHGKEPY